MVLMSANTNQSYDNLSESDDETEILFHEGIQKRQRHPPSPQQPVWPWIGTTILFACMFFISLVIRHQNSEYGTFERGFSNELGTFVSKLSRSHTVAKFFS
jgi:hypothetical protein